MGDGHGGGGGDHGHGVVERCHEGGVRGCLGYIVPLGPSMEGMGLRRAFAMGIRGTPWMTRGSFINVVSSFAGTIRELENSTLVS